MVALLLAVGGLLLPPTGVVCGFVLRLGIGVDGLMELRREGWLLVFGTFGFGLVDEILGCVDGVGL